MHELAEAQIFQFCSSCADAAEENYVAAACQAVQQDARMRKRAEPGDVRIVGTQLEDMRTNRAQAAWALIAGYYGVE